MIRPGLRAGELPRAERSLRPGDPGFDAYVGDAVLDGKPEVVVRPRSEDEVAEILRHAHAHRIPVTPAGGLSGLSGAGRSARRQAVR